METKNSFIELPQVTLILMSGIGYDTEGNVEALRKSQEGIKFGAVKYIQLGEIIDIDSWSKAIIYELPKYIETDYCLLIHSDGYIINPELWDDNWLNYDYIGAPWPLPQDNYSYRDIYGKIQRVGNSVSLRSRKLLGVPAKYNLEWKPFYGFYNEDGFIAVNNRHTYESDGCKFAPIEVAKYFGKEHELEENKDIKTFTFHNVG